MLLGFLEFFFTPQQMSVAFREACKDINGRITLENVSGCEEDWKWFAIQLNAKRPEGCITSLSIDHCNLSTNLIFLAEALVLNQTLIKLNLLNNRIKIESARHLAEALKGNQTLIKLDLRANGIGVAGVRHLAEALKENQTLTKLNLGSNYIGNDGVCHLAEALKENQTLTKLYFHNNSIGIGGARHLAEALKENQTLIKLNLHNNSIGDRRAETLKENLIGREFYLKLADRLKRNQCGKKRAAFAVFGLILIRRLKRQTQQLKQSSSKLEHCLQCLHIIPRELVAKIAQEMWRNKCYWVF